MGLVQSNVQTTDEAVEVEGLLFRIEHKLKRLIPIYGSVVVDYRNAFWGESFTVNFSHGDSC